MIWDIQKVEIKLNIDEEVVKNLPECSRICALEILRNSGLVFVQSERRITLSSTGLCLCQSSSSVSFLLSPSTFW